MDHAISVAALDAGAQVIADLANLLVEVVANGGSVGFMHPLAPERAAAFWAGSLAAAGREERVVLGARAGARLAGTVTLQLDGAENQPHRAEIAKLMTAVDHRGHGLAGALMREAERIAIARGRTLLTLDTAVDGGAAGLYEALGYNLAGVIPSFALKPHGGLTGTAIYFKMIGAPPPV